MIDLHSSPSPRRKVSSCAIRVFRSWHSISIAASIDFNRSKMDAPAQPKPHGASVQAFMRLTAGR